MMKGTVKKTTAGILAVILLAVGTAGALAANPGQNFRDADGDGVCDLCGAAQGHFYADTDGDGVCDRTGTACRRADGSCVQGNRAAGAGRGFRGGFSR